MIYRIFACLLLQHTALRYQCCTQAGMAQMVKDEAMSSPACVIFQTCDFLINLLSSKVAFFIFIISLLHTSTRAWQLWLRCCSFSCLSLGCPMKLQAGMAISPSSAVTYQTYRLHPFFADHTSPSKEAACWSLPRGLSGCCYPWSLELCMSRCTSRDVPHPSGVGGGRAAGADANDSEPTGRIQKQAVAGAGLCREGRWCRRGPHWWCGALPGQGSCSALAPHAQQQSSQECGCWRRMSWRDLHRLLVEHNLWGRLRCICFAFLSAMV